MINIGIIDVDQKIHNKLVFLLENYFAKTDDMIRIHHYHSAEAFCSQDETNIDILISDVVLPDGLGMDVVKTFRKSHPWQPIILMSDSEEFVLQGYQVSAIGYVLKPIDDKNMYFFIEKAHNRVLKEKIKEINIKTREGIVSIPSDRVLYIEIQGHVLHIHYFSNDNIYNVRCRGTLSEYEKILEPYGFARCCVYALVNMRYVTSVRGTEVYLSKSNEELPLSRSNRNEFLNCFYDFLSESTVLAA